MYHCAQHHLPISCKWLALAFLYRRQFWMEEFSSTLWKARTDENHHYLSPILHCSTILINVSATRRVQVQLSIYWYTQFNGKQHDHHQTVLDLHSVCPSFFCSFSLNSIPSFFFFYYYHFHYHFFPGPTRSTLLPSPPPFHHISTTTPTRDGCLPGSSARRSSLDDDSLPLSFSLPFLTLFLLSAPNRVGHLPPLERESDETKTHIWGNSFPLYYVYNFRFTTLMAMLIYCWLGIVHWRLKCRLKTHKADEGSFFLVN